MAFSYSLALTSGKDQVRFLIGDTASDDALLQDEEINYVLTQTPDPYRAAVIACQAIVGSLSKQVSTAIGQTKLSLEQRAEAYRLRVRELRDQASVLSPGLPYAGGISRADKFAVASDTDRVPPFVTGNLDSDPALGDGAQILYPPGYGY